MSSGDYILGAAAFGFVFACSGLVGLLIVRRRLAYLDGACAITAGLLIAVTALIAIHVAVLALGVFSDLAVILAASLAGAASLLVPPSATAQRHPSPASPPGTAAGWVLAALAAVPAAAVVVAAVRAWLPQPPSGVDTLTFHLPVAARWIEHGTLWRIDEFIPLQAHGTYPNHGDVVLLSALWPWDNDAFVRIPMLALLAAFAIAVWAVGKELGAPRPVRVSLAVGLVAIPSLARATIPRAMPDILLAFALAAAVLFLLRHARTRGLGDLVLGALGLGLALGTKWYGAPAAAVACAVVGAGLLRSDGLRASARATLIASAVALASGGVWMLRNWLEVSNPLFPVDTPLFSGPRDVVKEQVGFSIAHYLGDTSVLFGDLAVELYDGLGWLPVVLVVACVATVAIGRRGLPGRVTALLVATAALTAAYVVTPYSALGLEGAPDLAGVNTRYALPALIGAAATAMWLAGRSPRAGLALQAAVVVTTPTVYARAFEEVTPRGAAIALALLLALALAGLALQRARPPVRFALAGLLLLAPAGYGWRAQERLNRDRYTQDQVVAAVGLAPPGTHVAITGDWNANGLSPVWPSFGPRLQNEVSILGEHVDGFLANHADASTFQAQLDRLAPDLLVVGLGLSPRPGEVPDEQSWAEQAGWRPSARSDRLVLLLRG